MVKRENKFYAIISNSNAFNHLDAWDREILDAILGKIQDSRMKSGKRIDQKYWTVNVDEPYAEKVIKTIIAGEKKKLRVQA